MPKTDTQNKYAREIARREKELLKPKRRGYIIYLVMIICLVYITDEIASQICVQMKTEIANSLFASYGDRSVGMLENFAMISYPCMAVSLFYKTLSDRYGRKLFLVVNTLGMALGMLIIFMSSNILMYIVGFCIISFFVPHDMQVVYIMETAPAEKRARVYSAVKCVATLGVMLVPLMRKIFMRETSGWRYVFLVPAIVGFIATFLALMLSRETDAFLTSRLAYLRMTDEQRRIEKAKKDMQNAQGGFFSALKFSMKHRQLRMLFFLMAFNNTAFILTMQYQVMMSYGYAGNILAGGAAKTIDAAMEIASTGAVTDALFLFPIGSAFIQLAVGFLSDKLGRKISAAIMGAVTLFTMIGFVFCAKNGVSGYVTGLLSGICIGSFWAIGDINVMMMGESAPTNLRSSVASASYVISAIGTVIGLGVLLPLMNIMGNSVITTVVICISAPGLIAGIFAVLFFTGETKGMNMETVTGCEWDKVKK